jgi:hypothetical protein
MRCYFPHLSNKKKGGLERLANLPKVPQPIRGRTTIGTQKMKLHTSASSHKAGGLRKEEGEYKGFLWAVTEPGLFRKGN